MRFRRIYENLRCFVGLHRLKASERPQGEIAVPMDPRGRPGRGDWRKCDWCGAGWEGAYDGMAPFWRRTR